MCKHFSQDDDHMVQIGVVAMQVIAKIQTARASRPLSSLAQAGRSGGVVIAGAVIDFTEARCRRDGRGDGWSRRLTAPANRGGCGGAGSNGKWPDRSKEGIACPAKVPRLYCDEGTGAGREMG